MDRFIEGFVLGRMSASKPNGCGCLALAGFVLFLIFLCWNMARTPFARARWDHYYKHQQEIQQEQRTHTERDL